MQVSTSFNEKALYIILFVVSRNESGKSELLNLPKNDRNNAASVLLRVPVLPIRHITNFGSYKT